MLRDVLVLASAFGLMALDRTMRAEGGALAVVVACAAGVLVTVSGFYLHEWGHFLAARAAGASPVPAASPIAIFLFELSEDACTRRQWLAMSLGGYAASIVGLAVILAVVDASALSGRVALGLTSLGVLATFVLEIPITYRVWRKPEPG